MMKQYGFQLVSLVLFLAVGACDSPSDNRVSGDDLAAMKRAARAYSEAWLTNDPEAVMATFVPDPVLSPSGMHYIEGSTAARGFWWPEDSPSAVVNRFDYQELEAAGSGDIGYVRGMYALGFEFNGEPYTSYGKFLHLMKRDKDGAWRISHHFWNDLPPNEDQ